MTLVNNTPGAVAPQPQWGSNLPGWLGPLLGVGGGILQGIGRNRQRGATRAEDTRLEAETIKRAKAKAALMRGILNAHGYGNMMTDDQLVDLLTRTDRRTNTEGGIFGDIGGALLTGGADLAGAWRPKPEAPAPAPAATTTPQFGAGSATSQDIYDWIDQVLQSTPPIGGPISTPTLT